MRGVGLVLPPVAGDVLCPKFLDFEATLRYTRRQKYWKRRVRFAEDTLPPLVNVLYTFAWTASLCSGLPEREDA